MSRSDKNEAQPGVRLYAAPRARINAEFEAMNTAKLKMVKDTLNCPEAKKASSESLTKETVICVFEFSIKRVEGLTYACVGTINGPRIVPSHAVHVEEPFLLRYNIRSGLVQLRIPRARIIQNTKALKSQI
jgi:hypothetical protein